MILVAGRFPNYDVDELVDDKRRLDRLREIIRSGLTVPRHHAETRLSDRERFALVEALYFDGATLEEAGKEERGIGRETARCHILVALRSLRQIMLNRFEKEG